MSPTARTLKALRDDGYMAGVVEFWNPHTKTRRDLFGFLDIVAARPGQILGVQATSTGNGKSRVRKIITECADSAGAWIGAGGTIEVWGWRRYAKPVARKWWRPRVWAVEQGESGLVAELVREGGGE